VIIEINQYASETERGYNVSKRSLTRMKEAT
jgi:hypothetical protein